MYPWVEFLACAAAIFLSGARLARHGDVIAEKTGLGRAWIGLLLLAGVTSLPELITGASSVTLARSPDIAVGNILGSCVYNLATIAVLDILQGRRPIFARTEHGHVLAAGYGVVLTGLVVLAVIARGAIPAVGHVSLASLAIAAVYLGALRSLFLFEQRRMAGHLSRAPEPERYRELTVRAAAIAYLAHALVIVAAGLWLPVAGRRIAAQSALGESFVGTLVVSAATTLPEFVVSLAALRIGSADMAIANLLGSNLFNVFILALDDLWYLPGPLFAAVSPGHAATGLIGLLMTGVVIVSLTYRVERKAFLRLGWDTVALLLAFLVNAAFLYAGRGGP